MWCVCERERERVCVGLSLRTCETHALEEEAVRKGKKTQKNLLYVAKDADVVGFHEVYCHTLPPIPFRKRRKK